MVIRLASRRRCLGSNTVAGKIRNVLFFTPWVGVVGKRGGLAGGLKNDAYLSGYRSFLWAEMALGQGFGAC